MEEVNGLPQQAKGQEQPSGAESKGSTVSHDAGHEVKGTHDDYQCTQNNRCRYGGRVRLCTYYSCGLCGAHCGPVHQKGAQEGKWIKL